MEAKIKQARKIISGALDRYGERIAVGCSWGKDSIALLHLILDINPDVPVFSILTKYKPAATLEYALQISELFKIDPKFYLVADSIPPILKQNGLSVTLIDDREYCRQADRAKQLSGQNLHHFDPKLCCQLLKLMPTRVAYNDMELKAWFSGLRSTEGHTRTFIKIIEKRSEREVKVNPILNWLENEVWKYLEDYNIPPHPWYVKDFGNGRRIRSLGCEPCTVPIYEYESERDGRWRGTMKMAGECGIHTQPLRKIQIDEA